jgi:hypothetical protein
MAEGGKIKPWTDLSAGISEPNWVDRNAFKTFSRCDGLQNGLFWAAPAPPGNPIWQLPHVHMSVHKLNWSGVQLLWHLWTKLQWLLYVIEIQEPFGVFADTLRSKRKPKNLRWRLSPAFSVISVTAFQLESLLLIFHLPVTTKTFQLSVTVTKHGVISQLNCNTIK